MKRNVINMRFGTALSWCLVVVLLILVFEPRRGPASQIVAEAAKVVRASWLRIFDWPGIRDGASTIHGTFATVDLVVFTDYECPFCQSQDAVLDSLRVYHPSIGVAVRHVARPGSVRGRRLALTALCAQSTDAWPRLHALLYDLARVPDQAFRERQILLVEELQPGRGPDIAACSETPPVAVSRRFQRDSTLMAQLRLAGTPTILGWGLRIDGLRSLAELQEMLPRRTREEGIR